MQHVGIRRYQSFLRQVYDLLDDNGTFLLQVAGIRPHWQYEDLIWGLFMNKYIFPGADASCSLGWVVSQLESAGFEVKNIDVLGVHYSATIWRWYKNWVSNKEKVLEAYGDRWYRIWVFFLAYSTIISRWVFRFVIIWHVEADMACRNGGASVFQLTLHKNLNAYPRVLGVPNHASIHVKPAREISYVLFFFRPYFVQPLTDPSPPGPYSNPTLPTSEPLVLNTSERECKKREQYIP